MIRRLLVVTLLMACTLTGCIPTGDDARRNQPAEGGTVTLGLAGAPSGVLHPYVSTDPDDRSVLRLLYNGLLKPGPDGMWVCDLCDEFSVAPDNLSVTVSLRGNLQWHDGTPLTARDVAFTYRRLLRPGYAGPHAEGLAPLVGVEQLLDRRDQLARQVAEGRLTERAAAAQGEAAYQEWYNKHGQQALETDDIRTITFHLAEPYGPFLTMLSLPILPAHIWEGVEWQAVAGHDAARRPVGSGPFRVKADQSAPGLSLVRHEHYHGGNPWVHEVVFRTVRVDAVAAELQAGRLDWAPVTPEQALGLLNDPAVTVVQRPGTGYQYLGLNQAREPFGDRRVRQALLMGIDRTAMIQQVLGGFGTAVNTHMAPHWAWYDHAAVKEYRYNPEQAASLLAEAGWTELNADGHRVRNGRVLGFTLNYPQGNKARETSAGLIKQDLAKIGVKVTLEKVAFAQLVREVFGERKADAWLLGWELGADPAPGPQFLPGNKWGAATGWTNDRSEWLIGTAQRQLAPEARRPYYAEWATLVNAELPFLFLYMENELDAVRSDRLVGAEGPDPLSGVERWWVRPPKGS